MDGLKKLEQFERAKAFRLVGYWAYGEQDLEAIICNGKLVYFGTAKNLPISQINEYQMSNDNFAKE